MTVEPGIGNSGSGSHLGCSFNVGLEVLRGTIGSNLSRVKLVTYQGQFLLHDIVDQKLLEAIWEECVFFFC